MKQKKKQPQLMVEKLEHNFPNLLSPTENVKENLARGTAGLVSDPDDIPGGFNLDGTARPDMEESDAEVEQESEEGGKINEKEKQEKSK